MSSPKPATSYTSDANAAVLNDLPFSDTTDFDNAKRGLIAKGTGQIKNAAGDVVWDMDKWEFLDGVAPDTVNPSLWRQSQIVSMAGLYKVTDGVYQVRGFDLSVTSWIRSDSGWIVVDPLISTETAAAAYDMIKKHVEDLPIVAVIHTHSHVDHYGGVTGVVSEDDVAAGKVKIVAPIDFLDEAISENVMLGNVMTRRATYMYGDLVGFGAHRGVGTGLGQNTSSGNVTLIPPTDIITKTGQEMTIDGVRLVFQHTPGAEAPAEMCFYIPDRKAWCMAEIVTHNLHNVYTLRGAKIRDAKIWSTHINDAINLHGDEAEVLFSSHHWPTWGKENIVDLMKSQRDMYRYMHDETLRLANSGYNYTEIGEMIKLPDGIAKRFANRDYYGAVNHNVKGTYVFYLGWFDGNPATLNPLPPVDTGKKMVEYMGGADAILARAKKDFDAGEYRFVAQALNHLIFSDPDNQEAKNLQADTLEQLGYQTENGQWRNFYLTGAMELRDGVKSFLVPHTASKDTVAAMPISMFLDFLGVRLNGPKAASKKWTFNLVFTDADETHYVEVVNGVLNHNPVDSTVDGVTATLTMKRTTLNKIIVGDAKFKDLVGDGSITVDGSEDAFENLIGLLDTFDLWFDIVTP